VQTTTTLAQAAWEKITPTGDLPTARLGGSLVYVPTLNKFLLFGGWAGGAEYLNGVWSYDPRPTAGPTCNPKVICQRFAPPTPRPMIPPGTG